MTIWRIAELQDGRIAEGKGHKVWKPSSSKASIVPSLSAILQFCHPAIL
jgi:hypothetical protein